MNTEVDPKIRIIDLRNRVLAGETLSKEEIAEALSALTQNRRAASTRATSSRKPKGEPLPADLSELF